MEDLLFDVSVPEVEHKAESSVESSPRGCVSAPLPVRLRPGSFEEYVGQRHLLAPGCLLRRAIDADRFSSIILHGPPGVGKTSLAELIATVTGSAFVRLSGVVSSVADIRSAVAEAIQRRRVSNRSTILFVDEIHRFNKARQDVLLPDVENGNIRMIGATTMNPNFYIVGPLLSRSLVFRLEPLSRDDISNLILSALKRPAAFGERFRVEMEPDAVAFLAEASEGDARKALNAVEIAVETTAPVDGVVRVTKAVAEESIQRKALEYGADGHYDTASAFIKSMRGSDPDAAIYWLAKMLAAGEDISFIARRIVIFASEDVGNSDPVALNVAMNAMKAAEAVGMPEARIILSQAVAYCATAPKSNASYKAIDAALADIENERVSPVPQAIRDAHYKGAKSMGHGVGYVYPHDQKDHFAVQEYLGVEKRYYVPTGLGFEAEIKKRMEYWNKLRGKAFGDTAMVEKEGKGDVLGGTKERLEG